MSQYHQSQLCRKTPNLHRHPLAFDRWSALRRSSPKNSNKEKEKEEPSFLFQDWQTCNKCCVLKTDPNHTGCNFLEKCKLCHNTPSQMKPHGAAEISQPKIDFSKRKETCLFDTDCRKNYIIIIFIYFSVKMKCINYHSTIVTHTKNPNKWISASEWVCAAV